MAGKPAAALAITDRAHEHGADLGVMLQDLLELVHTRDAAEGGARRCAISPNCRKPSARAAGRWRRKLSMATLGRAWQMLLKGIGEVEAAPDRRAAAEMVLIRLCYVADLPPPGELVRRLTDEGGAAAPAFPRATAAAATAAAAGRRRARGRGRRDGRRRGAAACRNFRDVAGAGRAARADAARASRPFRASGALRPAGDRVAPEGGRAARPRRPPRRGAAARRPARAGRSRSPPTRASRRWPRRARRRTRRGGMRRRNIRWCARSSTPFPARASRRCGMTRWTPTACRRSEAAPAERGAGGMGELR